MKLPLQITARGTDLLPSLEPEIHRRVATLDKWSPDVMSCQVVIVAEGSRRRSGPEFRVNVGVRLPDELVFTGDHRDKDALVALQGAFDVLDRRLEQYASRHRGEAEPRPVVLRGRIEALSNDGVGRIVSQSGDEYRFGRAQVEHPNFEHLAVGQEVRFLEGWSRTGREARRVSASTG